MSSSRSSSEESVKRKRDKSPYHRKSPSRSSSSRPEKRTRDRSPYNNYRSESRSSSTRPERSRDTRERSVANSYRSDYRSSSTRPDRSRDTRERSVASSYRNDYRSSSTRPERRTRERSVASNHSNDSRSERRRRQRSSTSDDSDEVDSEYEASKAQTVLCPVSNYPDEPWVEIRTLDENGYDENDRSLWRNFKTDRKLSTFQDMKKAKGPIKTLVIIRLGKEHPYSVLQRTVAVWNRQLKLVWKVPDEKERKKEKDQIEWTASIAIDKVTISKITGKPKRQVKRAACEMAIYKLQKYFYSAEMTRSFITEYFFERPNKWKEATIDLTADDDSDKETEDAPNEKKIKMIRLDDVEDADVSDPVQMAAMFDRLKAVIDEYSEDKEEKRELVFARQFNLEFYREVEQYAEKTACLKTRYVGVRRYRMLVAFKTENLKWNTWKLLKAILIDREEGVAGLRIVKPRRMPKPLFSCSIRERTIKK